MSRFEAVIRAIEMTAESMPLDIVLHTPGGLVLAAEQIASVLANRPRAGDRVRPALRDERRHPDRLGRRPSSTSRPAYPDPPVTFKQLVLAAGRGSARPVTWRRGSRRTKNNPTAAMRSQFLRLRIRPANRDIGRGEDGALPECWLIAE